MLRGVGEHQRVEEAEGGRVPGGEALRLHEDVRRGHGGPSQEKVPPHQLGECPYSGPNFVENRNRPILPCYATAWTDKETRLYRRSFINLGYIGWRSGK